MNIISKKNIALMTSSLVLASSLSLPVYAGEASKAESSDKMSELKADAKKMYKDSKAGFENGWLVGKLESTYLLNEHLSAFAIDVDAQAGAVTLSGKVQSDIQKDLAENIAIGMKGVNRVVNNIEVDAKAEKTLSEKTAESKNEFVGYVKELSTSAAIKTELLTNKNVKGMDIEVDTEGNKVILSGKVETKRQKALAESIAKKRESVEKVVNKIEVASS